MKILVVLCGLPGAGKSTIASLFKGAFIINADKFRIKDGKYRYRAKENTKIFEKCEEAFFKAIKQNRKLIVSDNTNTSLPNIIPYERYAEENGYIVIKLFVACTVADSKKRRPRVPLKTIKSMHEWVKSHFNYATTINSSYVQNIDTNSN